MTILRHYAMVARDGEGDALRDALTRLARQVGPLSGCQGVELYADPHKREAFVFIERWDSIETHKAAGAALGKEAFVSVMAVLSAPPEERYLAPIAENAS